MAMERKIESMACELCGSEGIDLMLDYNDGGQFSVDMSGKVQWVDDGDGLFETMKDDIRVGQHIRDIDVNLYEVYEHGACGGCEDEAPLTLTLSDGRVTEYTQEAIDFLCERD